MAVPREKFPENSWVLTSWSSFLVGDGGLALGSIYKVAGAALISMTCCSPMQEAGICAKVAEYIAALLVFVCAE